MAGGPGNPLGARAMYLGNTVYRIHGTNAPDTIGTARVVGLHPPDQRGRRGPVQSRLVGAKVVVLPMNGHRPADVAQSQRPAPAPVLRQRVSATTNFEAPRPIAAVPNHRSPGAGLRLVGVAAVLIAE